MTLTARTNSFLFAGVDGWYIKANNGWPKVCSSAKLRMLAYGFHTWTGKLLWTLFDGSRLQRQLAWCMASAQRKSRNPIFVSSTKSTLLELVFQFLHCSEKHRRVKILMKRFYSLQEFDDIILRSASLFQTDRLQLESSRPFGMAHDFAYCIVDIGPSSQDEYTWVGQKFTIIHRA